MSAANMVWIDMEMSGLDPERCHILEIATIITDSDLNVVAEGPDLIVHQNEQVLSAMDEWCQEHHGKSGLTQAVRASTLLLAEAEAQTLAFIQAHTPRGKAALCGNSVWQDRRFLQRYMPSIDEWLHYRIIDVSTVKELARRWYPSLPAVVKAETHRALQDIRESIAELQHYRDNLFRAPQNPSENI